MSCQLKIVVNSSTKSFLVSVDIIYKLCPFVEDWCKYFGSNEILEDLLLTLIASCDNGGIQIINVLLDCITVEHHLSDPLIQSIKEKSLEILRKRLSLVCYNF